MTLVKIHSRLSVNPAHVTCVRMGSDGILYVELVTGTRHEMRNITLEQVMNLINGVDTQRVTS